MFLTVVIKKLITNFIMKALVKLPNTQNTLNKSIDNCFILNSTLNMSSGNTVHKLLED